jgi:hypothetical protein
MITSEDAWTELGTDGSTRSALPALTPGPAASRVEVEQLVRDARAELAVLARQLQLAIGEADVAEAASRGRVRSSIDEATRDVAELVRGAVTERAATRRAELGIELERARETAADVVTAAKAQADAIRANGREHLREVFVPGLPTSLPPIQPRPQTADDTPTLPRLVFVDIVLPVLAVVVLIVLLLAVLG